MWVKTCFDLDNEPCTIMPVCQIDSAADTVKLLIFNTFRDTFKDLLRTYHKRQFCYYNSFFPGCDIFNMGRRTCAERPAACMVCFADAVTPHNNAATRQIRPGDVMHKVFGGCIRMLHQVFCPGNDFTEIVCRHICRHTDGNAGCAVNKQIGDCGREYCRLFKLVVIVRGEIDCIFADRFIHPRCRRSQPRLSIP